MYWFKRTFWLIFLLLFLFGGWLIVYFVINPKSNDLIYNFLSNYNPDKFIPENSQQHPEINYQIEFKQDVTKPIAWSELSSGDSNDIINYANNSVVGGNINNINANNLGDYDMQIEFSSDPSLWPEDVSAIEISFLIGVFNFTGQDSYSFSPIWDSEDEVLYPDQSIFVINKADSATTLSFDFPDDIAVEGYSLLRNFIFYSFWIDIDYNDGTSLSTENKGQKRGFIANDIDDLQQIKNVWYRPNGTFATDYYDENTSNPLVDPSLTYVSFGYLDNPVAGPDGQFPPDLPNQFEQILSIAFISLFYNNNLPDWLQNTYDLYASKLNDALVWVAFIVICFVITFVTALITVFVLFISSSYKNREKTILRKYDKLIEKDHKKK